MDRGTKKAHDPRMGVPSYRLLDPAEPDAPTVFALRRGYAHVVGDEAFDAAEPFPVRVVPARLLVGTRP